MENKIRVVELFAGIGAQRQALKDDGINHEIMAVSEIDKYALYLNNFITPSHREWCFYSICEWCFYSI